ncbi:putative E3 ubiquitin-protein ligase XBOS34 [Cardamine amara subsp. amara]|uniref:E3 ubiquitin-protein ligase XBOS34 n=1 Tax=Cardamine amara subsp. amara TaxID=228776 RepID=A0ABD1A0N9_CARAN
MASSQVEIVSLRSSFGCVLRDRNQRNNDDDVIFKKNLKAQVKTVPDAIADENSQNRVDSWIGNKPKKNNKSRLGSPEKTRSRKENKFSGNERRRDNLGGASSLVQIWEARLIRSNGGNSPIHGQSTESGSSVASVQDIDLSAPESESENESKNPDRTVEIESKTLNTVSDSGESKWGRVAEIIRRLSNEQKLTVGGNGGAVEKPIVKTSTPEKSSFPVVTSSPRLRGRQAYSDLLVRLERDRHHELKSLLERNAVSRFPQRGRLQSMLRLRSFKRGLAIQDRHRGSAKSDVSRVEPGSTVLHLREKFRENAAKAATEAERMKGQVQQSTVETESMRSKEISILQETSSTERLSPRNRKIEDAILRKNETESKMSYLELKETIVTEPQILENEEAEKVETPFLGKEETSFFANEWEDQEEYEDEQSYYGDMSYDWFTEISRPRTYWEDLRKSRYLEVMNIRSDKDDICRLLERRTVSDFLQSGLRETIDKLIMSRVPTRPSQRIEKAVKEEEKCDIGEEEDEHRDDLSQTSSQIFLPSPAGSWSSQDTGVTSTPLHTLQSTEMEMISDLRSQILQLQLEMSELRDSVKTCLDVNASLQKSVHRENPFKRKCCVCNEAQVETLLYRCGHMCTCLRCANELQCNGGKCPICRAKIVDVVRVFVDSRT